MKIAYLMNAYPMTSTTFIRREIEAHERAGIIPDRFAIRPWDTPLVDPLDIAEAGRVTYLLDGDGMRLLASFFAEAASNPRGMVRVLGATAHLMRKAKVTKWKALAYLVEAVSLKRQAAVREIDHVHTHFSSNSAAVAMLSRLLGGPTYSVTIHGPDELFQMKENALALKVRHAAFIAAITEYCRKLVDDHTDGIFKDKIHIVRCGLDLADFWSPTDVPDTGALVCVGRLCEMKSQHILVEGFARIAHQHPKAKLTLIGDGPMRHRIEQAVAENGLEAQVELAGWRTNEQVCAMLKDARALVLPSLAEGLPIVIMESFALGRPVLSTRITGIPELVDDSCGWLVEPGDIESLATKLDVVLSASPDLLTNMARMGRRRVEKMHDQDANAGLLRDLISQALA